MENIEKVKQLVRENMSYIELALFITGVALEFTIMPISNYAQGLYRFIVPAYFCGLAFRLQGSERPIQEPLKAMVIIYTVDLIANELYWNMPLPPLATFMIAALVYLSYFILVLCRFILYVFHFIAHCAAFHTPIFVSTKVLCVFIAAKYHDKLFARWNQLSDRLRFGLLYGLIVTVSLLR